MKKPESLIPIRARRAALGLIFIASGVFHAAVMGLAAATTYGWVRNTLPQGGWESCYLLHFVGTTLAGAAYVYLIRAAGVGCVVQLLLDLAFGAFVFDGLFHALRRLIAAGWISPWLGTLASGWLLFYGRRLQGGRQVWSKLELL